MLQQTKDAKDRLLNAGLSRKDFSCSSISTKAGFSHVQITVLHKQPVIDNALAIAEQGFEVTLYRLGNELSPHINTCGKVGVWIKEI